MVAIPAASASHPPKPDKKMSTTTNEQPRTEAILRVLASAEAQTLCHMASEKIVEAPREAPKVKIEIQPASLTPRFGGRGLGRGVLYECDTEERISVHIGRAHCKATEMRLSISMQGNVCKSKQLRSSKRKNPAPLPGHWCRVGRQVR